jgi:SAM-dependent methyltransferase
MTKSDSWDAAAQARVSDRWAKASADWNTAMTDALLAAAALDPDSVVLDLAAGSGDPALSVAQRLIGGRVIALDSSRAGLLLANTHGRQLRLASKIVCIQGDAHAIPLAPNCMDRITCRCGIMFFSDTGLVMSEMLRVLKPGGRVALLAWGSFEQPFFDAIIGPVLLVRGAEMPPEARTMFRFASPGSLERELRAGGFSSVHEESPTLPRIWAGSPQELWRYQQEVSTLCHPLFASIPSGLRAQVDAEVLSALARFRSGSVLEVPAKVIVAVGQRKLPSNSAPR